MKALTLTQPWATLVAIGAKRIETRSWNTAYRGPLSIHAAKGWTTEDRDLCMTEPFRSVLGAWKETLPNPGMQSIISALPHAAIIAVVDLVRTFSTHEDTAFDLSRRAGTPARGTSFTIPEHEAAFGNYAPGRYGFLFDNRRALAEPVPARGMLSLWEVPPDVQAAIDAQLAAVAA